MLELLVANLIDVLVAFVMAGCVWGLARAKDRRLDFLHVVAWTFVVMCALAAWGERQAAVSGRAAPEPANVVPLLIFAVGMYLIVSRRGSGRRGAEGGATGAAELGPVEAELAG